MPYSFGQFPLHDFQGVIRHEPIQRKGCGASEFTFVHAVAFEFQDGGICEFDDVGTAKAGGASHDFDFWMDFLMRVGYL